MRTRKQIIASINSIATSAKRLQVKIHEVALECLAHAEAHGDATLMQRLYLSLPNGQRREALLVWCDKYSPVRVTQKGEKCGVLPTTSPKYVAYNLAEAAENPYWTIDELDLGIKAAPADIAKVIKSGWNKAHFNRVAIENYPDKVQLIDGYSPSTEIEKWESAARALGIELGSPDDAALLVKVADKVAA